MYLFRTQDNNCLNERNIHVKFNRWVAITRDVNEARTLEAEARTLEAEARTLEAEARTHEAEAEARTLEARAEAIKF